MSAEDSHSGIPTRAIHEAYLDMQRSLKAYREAKDQQHQPAIQQAHGELQQAVLTFYELLRPHIRHESSVSDYWHGELPNYNGNGEPPDLDDGKGVIQVQTKRRPIQLNGLSGTTEQLQTLEDWHDALDMNGSVRLAGVVTEGQNAIITVQEYQKGLRHMDDWETKYTRTVERKSGFMSDKTETEVSRQRVPIDRLKRAARELADVADKLGALSDFDASGTNTEVTEEQIKRLEKWRKQNLDQS